MERGQTGQRQDRQDERLVIIHFRRSAEVAYGFVHLPLTLFPRPATRPIVRIDANYSQRRGRRERPKLRREQEDLTRTTCSEIVTISTIEEARGII